MLITLLKEEGCLDQEIGLMRKGIGIGWGWREIGGVIRLIFESRMGLDWGFFKGLGHLCVKIRLHRHL